MHSRLMMILGVLCVSVAAFGQPPSESAATRSEPGWPNQFVRGDPEAIKAILSNLPEEYATRVSFQHESDGVFVLALEENRADLERTAAFVEQKLVAMHDRERAEDLAVMSELLREALDKFYDEQDSDQTEADRLTLIRRLSLDLTGLPPTPQQVAELEPVGTPLATYLDGYGVVLQVRSWPLPSSSLIETKVELKSAPITPWQRAQRKLRGEDPDSQGWQVLGVLTSPEGDLRQKLTNVLIDLLHENGHNFRHLKPEERVTVAVTFEASAAAQNAWKTSNGVNRLWSLSQAADPERTPSWRAWLNDSNASASGNQPAALFDLWRAVVANQEPSGGNQPATEDPNAPTESTPDGQQPDPRVVPKSVNLETPLGLAVLPQEMPIQEELTGDLHMRQGDCAKAAEMFEQVLKVYPEHPRHVEHLKKLVQAYVGLGDAGSLNRAKELLERLDKARQAEAEHIQAAIDQGIEYLNLHRDKWSSAHLLPQGFRPYAPPARLTVSANLSDLQEAAAGTITKEQFADRVKVSYSDPAAESATSSEAAPSKN